MLAKEAKPLAHRDAALQKKAADLIDHSCPITDQARSYAVQRLQIQLIVGLHRNAACRRPLHGFRDRVGVSEIVLVALTERPGISRRHLLHLVTERYQLASHIMRRHAGLDANQAPRHVRKPCCDPAARELLAQNNRTLLIKANQMERLLTPYGQKIETVEKTVSCPFPA